MKAFQVIILILKWFYNSLAYYCICMLVSKRNHEKGGRRMQKIFSKTGLEVVLSKKLLKLIRKLAKHANDREMRAILAVLRETSALVEAEIQSER